MKELTKLNTPKRMTGRNTMKSPRVSYSDEYGRGVIDRLTSQCPALTGVFLPLGLDPGQRIASVGIIDRQ